MLPRRLSDPSDVQRIWNVLSSLSYQKINPDFNKLLRELVLIYGYTLSKWEVSVLETIKDGLIKKSNSGNNSYIFPETLPESDGMDWYCYECHKAGIVAKCENDTCHRVFHKNCVEKSAEKYELIKNCLTNNESVLFLQIGSTPNIKTKSTKNECKTSTNNSYNRNECIRCNIEKFKCLKIPQSQLNRLLEYLWFRIKSWLPSNITHRMNGSDQFPESVTQDQLNKRTDFLFFNKINMTVIKNKVYNETYEKCQDILMDVLDIQHNNGIFHGLDSQEYMASEYIFNDTVHDLGEIMSCADCYEHSNEKINENWFCVPCKKEHVLVWAKQRGFSFWPAKLLNETETHCDVRFFGGKHGRAFLPKKSIEPITKTRESLKVKMSGSLKKALAELELHMKLKNDPKALKEFIKSSTNKIRARSCTPTRRIKTPEPNCSKLKRSNSLSNLTTDNIPLNNLILPTKSRGTTPKQDSQMPTPIRGRPSKKQNSNNARRYSCANVEDCNDDIYAFDGNDISTAAKPIRRTRSKSMVNKFEASHNSQVEKRTTLEEKDSSTSPSPKKRKRPAKKQISTNSTSVKTRNQRTTSSNVNNMSDLSDCNDIYTFNGNEIPTSTDYDRNDQTDQVTSSTGLKYDDENLSLIYDNIQSSDFSYSVEIEEMKRKMSALNDKNDLIKCAAECIQNVFHTLNEKHKDNLKQLSEAHSSQISRTKKRQWCYYCEQNAIYHCCWNTAYCSTVCQQKHWDAEHKKVCRRKSLKN